MSNRSTELPLLNKQTHPAPYQWSAFVAALRAGHRLPKPQLQDVLLGPPGGVMLSRAAWVEGLGYGVKSVTVMEGNPAKGLPSIHGGMLVFDAEFGQPKAVVDSDLVTDIKTATDSVFGALLLAPESPKNYLIIGAGTVSRNVAEAYRSQFPSLQRLVIWNRTRERAQLLVDELLTAGHPAELAEDLPSAVAEADLITTATMSVDPVLQGDWVSPGTHVDLIGAFRPDMREADDALLQKARLFVDSRDTTLEHIGELKIPITSGAITADNVLGDFYDLVAGAQGRTSPQDITVFKNGGGAHLDLMIANALLASV